MEIEEKITAYINSLTEPKRSEIEALHQIMLTQMPSCKLWFLDGKSDLGKIVSNPSIGYGILIKEYADGKSRPFYQLGLSSNTAGISVYIMGISDKTYLAQTYGKKLGKASISGYCIKFKKLTDINIEILKEAIKYGYEQSN